MSKKNESELKKYMTKQQRESLGELKTFHSNCTAATGVARPGKTARDKAKKLRSSL